jgi:hypothetical protein
MTKLNEPPKAVPGTQFRLRARLMECSGFLLGRPSAIPFAIGLDSHPRVTPPPQEHNVLCHLHHTLIEGGDAAQSNSVLVLAKTVAKRRGT